MNTSTKKNEQTVNEIQAAKALLQKHGYLPGMFHIDDIISHGKDNGIVITEEQALGIAEILDQKHDANEGINWSTIETATEIYFTKAA